MEFTLSNSKVTIVYYLNGFLSPSTTEFQMKTYWRREKFPADLKLNGEVVYKVIDEFTVIDMNGEKMDNVEFSMEMRD